MASARHQRLIPVLKVGSVQISHKHASWAGYKWTSLNACVNTVQYVEDAFVLTFVTKTHLEVVRTLSV